MVSPSLAEDRAVVMSALEQDDAVKVAALAVRGNARAAYMSRKLIC